MNICPSAPDRYRPPLTGLRLLSKSVLTAMALYGSTFALDQLSGYPDGELMEHRTTGHGRISMTQPAR